MGSEMKAPRTFAGLTTHDGCLYVCGGMTTQKADSKEVQWNTSTVEKFFPQSSGQASENSADENWFSDGGKWKGLASMLSPRLGPAVVTLEVGNVQYICAIGGVDGDGTALKTAERLDPITQKWTRLPDLPEARAASAAVTYQGEVFVFGGCGLNGVPMDTALKLDRAAKGWKPIPSLNVPRGGFGAVLAGSVVVLIGGSTKFSAHLKSTELIDLETLDKPEAHWIRGPDMVSERRYPAVAVAKMQTPYADV
eukprot:TRINITY_DN12281_c0_g1_i5.p2 TRINITY_DN12281_c0_g1~~TRINITY_DN12281_c0_g1_i5.p2  ORF type:complete len:252 (-),score=62.83 TRINITY_DN12281_c0_g1_i5:235-990(-)